MNIGLASYQFINHDIKFNISQIKKAAEKVSGKVELLCFGETFLQGFDALSWDYEIDKDIAISKDSSVMKSISKISKDAGVDLLFGYLEIEDETIYSSCILLSGYDVIHNYRRISTGWKVKKVYNNFHYGEGRIVKEFMYKNQKFLTALCGDLWVYPERFKTRGILLWPAYVTFSLEEWKKEEVDYAERALLASKNVLFISSITENPRSLGGAFYFKNGKVFKRLDFGKEGILVVKI